MINNTLWTEKYRPQTFDDYAGNAEFVSKMRGYIASGDVPHLLLHSLCGGTGKTTASRIVASSIDADVLRINASLESGIDIIRDKILPFVENSGFKPWKIVILDESDRLTTDFLQALRPILEDFSRNVRFILTCNYVDKIIQPIRSRCVEFEIENTPLEEIFKRLAKVLDAENVIYDDKELANVIMMYYPDQRSMLKFLQDNCKNGLFKMPKDSNSNVYALNPKVTDILMDPGLNGKDRFVQIRQLIADSRLRDFSKIYRYLFDTLDVAGKNGLIILTINDHIYKDAFVIDKEINFMACIVNLMNIIYG